MIGSECKGSLSPPPFASTWACLGKLPALLRLSLRTVSLCSRSSISSQHQVPVLQNIQSRQASRCCKACFSLGSASLANRACTEVINETLHYFGGFQERASSDSFITWSRSFDWFEMCCLGCHKGWQCFAALARRGCCEDKGRGYLA